MTQIKLVATGLDSLVRLWRESDATHGGGAVMRLCAEQLSVAADRQRALDGALLTLAYRARDASSQIERSQAISNMIELLEGD